MLTVYNDIKKENSIYITAPKAEYLKIGVTDNVIADENNIDFIDAGLRTLIVPISDLNNEITMYPDEASLKEFVIKNGIDIILVFSMQTSQRDYFAHTRVFAPKFGYLEDPATGSCNSAFANYLLKYNLWDGSAVNIEQEGDNITFNCVKLKTKGNDILFGGSASLRIEGYYFNN